MPTPDPLTPEERAALRVAQAAFPLTDAPLPSRTRLALADCVDALDRLARLAPKPVAAEPRRFESVPHESDIWVSANCPGFPQRVYLRETTPTPDPDREAREALEAAIKQAESVGAPGGSWFGRVLAALRAHGFAHRSEWAQSPKPETQYRIKEIRPDGYVMEPVPAPPPAERSGAVSPAAVDVVREALEKGVPGMIWDDGEVRAVTAALAARGVTFPKGA